MKSNKIYLFIGLLIVMVLAAACGQSAQVVPTIDTSARATSLAGTAVAAFGTATSTPAPTETLVPTAVVSVQGTSLATKGDGSTLFTDHKAGFQLTFPSGWLAMRVGELEYYAAWEKPSMQNPAFQKALASANNADPKVLRLIAFDTREGHVPGGLVTAMSVVFLEGDDQSLEEREKAKKAETRICAGFKFISSRFSETDNGIRTLLIEESCKAIGEGTLYYGDVFFNVAAGKVHLNFETNFDFKDTSLLDLEQVVNSLTLLNP